MTLIKLFIFSLVPPTLPDTSSCCSLSTPLRRTPKPRAPTDRRSIPRGRNAAAVAAATGSAAAVETGRRAGVGSVNAAAAETDGGVAAESAAAAESAVGATETTTSIGGGRGVRVPSGRRRVQSGSRSIT